MPTKKTIYQFPPKKRKRSTTVLPTAPSFASASVEIVNNPSPSTSQTNCLDHDFFFLRLRFATTITPTSSKFRVKSVELKDKCNRFLTLNSQLLTAPPFQQNKQPLNGCSLHGIFIIISQQSEHIDAIAEKIRKNQVSTE